MDKKSRLYFQDKRHNIISLITAIFIFTISILFIGLGYLGQFGYGTILILIFLIGFSSLKIIRSSTLLYNLNNKSKIIKMDRLNIYIYESWHKKYVGNFWIGLLFLFIWMYSFVLNIIFLYSDVNAIANYEIYWVFYVLFLSVLFIFLMIYFINKSAISKRVNSNKKTIERLGITSNELKSTTQSTKDDYKYFVHTIVGILLLFIPLLLLFNSKYNTFIKEL